MIPKSLASDYKLLLFIFWLTLPPSVSHGVSWELRSPLGAQLANPTSLNSEFSDKLKVSRLFAFGMDALFFPFSSSEEPHHPWAIGLRFDSLSSVTAEDDNNLEVAARLFSPLIHYRWRQGPLFFGPSLSWTLYQSSVVNLRQAGGPFRQYLSKKPQAGSLGFECGWVLDIYLLAFELGYQYLDLDDLQADDGSPLLSSSGERKRANLSGPFVKFLIGLHF